MTTAREIRFVLVADDYETAEKLYRDVFGLEVVMDLDGQGGRGVILRCSDRDDRGRRRRARPDGGPHRGRRPAGEPVPLAVEVDDLVEATAAVTEAGQEPIGER